MDIDISTLPTPSYLVDQQLLIKNLELLSSVKERTGCKILLAQKAFSMFSVYPLIAKYLDGVTSSGVMEARLGYEEMGKEVHTYAPAFADHEMDDVIRYSDHIVFNSFHQWNKFKDKVKNSGKQIECGLRLNPKYSEIDTDIYNPCFTGSRLGITPEQFQPDQLDGIDGLHFHTMCEQNSDTLERTLKVVDDTFGSYIKQMKWLNFGGGHHITRSDYDIETLIRCIQFAQDTYGVQVYLEPGEAVALNTGYLVSTVLDTIENGMHLAILETSAACHMPEPHTNFVWGLCSSSVFTKIALEIGLSNASQTIGYSPKSECAFSSVTRICFVFTLIKGLICSICCFSASVLGNPK